MDRILPPRHHYPLYRAPASRQIEAAALAAVRTAHGEPRLMVRAGLAIARLAAAVAPFADRVWIAAGPGNNGGDGIEAATHLHLSGRKVTLTLAADPARLPADAATSLQQARTAGVPIEAAPASPPTLAAHDLAIDALLGLGSNRAPDAAIAERVRQLNAQACKVLAVDLPTGIDGNTGQALGDTAVRATYTLALLTLKPGLFTGVGRDHCGVVWLDELGYASPDFEADAWLSGPVDSAAIPRQHATHKGSFGDVLAIGGAPGMSGAVLLCARAAHAAGAGRVWVVPLDPAALQLDLLRPELMWRNDPENVDDKMLGASTVVCGCGGGDAVRRLMPRLLDQGGRLVIDADALNAIADTPALGHALRKRGANARPTILTPHPLEAARLLGVTIMEVQRDRLAAARQLAERFGSVVILKGSGSIIAAPGVIPHVNSSGNAALATAGSGDVLAGWLGGRWSVLAGRACSTDPPRTLLRSAFEVACDAVWWHGATADAAELPVLRAADLIEAMAVNRRR